ncbi:hypothetical protein [Photobacterium minamisatsumaniensis]|uniref:hypothetical protein n=1 Tax=Photobacterium minamisatsumaniensis TaxID=2910233 RepID=UPI003D14A51F
MSTVVAIGYSLTTPFASEHYLAPPLPEPAPFVMMASTTVVYAKTAPTAWLPTLPSMVAVAKPGFWEREFKNNLFLKPKSVDLGFVVNVSQVPVQIWSSYTQPLTLNDIVKTGAKGIAINGQLPGDVLAPYGGIWQLRLDVSLDVDMVIDASFEWRFNHGLVSTVLIVSGTRIALWPYPPIYPVTESWQWFTAVTETRASEQRLCNADKPLQRIDYTYNLPNLAASEQTARYAAQGKERMVVPVWSDATSPVSANKGDMVIYIDVSSRSFQAGGMALLYKNERSYELAFIDQVNDGNLLLSRPLLFEHSNVILLPAMSCMATEGVRSSRQGSRTTQKITFVNSKPLELPALSPSGFDMVAEYLGASVIVQRGKGVSVADDMAFTWREKTTASGHHIVDAEQDYGRHSTTVEMIASNREQAWQLKQFLYQFKGRLNACWWVSYHRQIRIAAHCSRKRIVIERVGLVEFGDRHLYLHWRDGVQMVYAKSLGYDGDGNEVIDLGGDDDREVTPDDLLGGHIMRLMRPVDDQVKITHQPRQLLSVSMPMIEVPDGSH